MKKLLGLLGVLTITGNGLSTLTSNSLISTNNYLQTNDSNQLGSNFNRLEVEYRFFAHDKLKAHISLSTWETIKFEHDTSKEFSNQLLLTLNSFEQVNNSGGSSADKLPNSDLITIRDMIMEHYDEFNNVYEKIKTKENLGLVMVTLRDKTWSDYDPNKYGVWPDNVDV